MVVQIEVGDDIRVKLSKGRQYRRHILFAYVPRRRDFQWPPYFFGTGLQQVFRLFDTVDYFKAGLVIEAPESVREI